MGIRRYEVTRPPTSGEVKAHILQALASKAASASVHVRAIEGDIPRHDDELDLEFHVAQTGHPEEGGMRVLGHTPEGATVNMHIATATEEPATLSLVISD